MADNLCHKYKMPDILCHKYIFHLTSLMLNTKVLNFTVFRKNCEKIMSELCGIFINLITFDQYMKSSWNVMLDAQSVPCSTDTSPETTAPLADSSIHDRLVKASPFVDQALFKFVDVSYSGSVNFLLQYTAQML